MNSQISQSRGKTTLKTAPRSTTLYIKNHASNKNMTLFEKNFVNIWSSFPLDLNHMKFPKYFFPHAVNILCTYFTTCLRFHRKIPSKLKTSFMVKFLTFSSLFLKIYSMLHYLVCFSFSLGSVYGFKKKYLSLLLIWKLFLWCAIL